MSHNGLRLSVLGVALLLIAGCGGGSNTGSNSGGSGGGTGGSGGGNGGGNGGGSGDQPTTVTFSLISGTPAQIAVKVGSGNYTAAALTSNKLTISIPSGTTTYSIAYLCPPYGSGNSAVDAEYIEFNGIQDGTSISGQCPGQANGTTPAEETLTGTLDASAFPTAVSMEAEVSNPSYGQLNDVPLSQGQPAGGSFQLSGATGSDRVVLSLYDSHNNVLAIKNFNNQAVPGTLNGGNAVTFGSADAITPQPITFTNLPSGYGTPDTNVSFLDGAVMLGSGALTQYAQLPAGILQSGEYLTIQSSASPSTGPSVIGSIVYLASGGPVTLSFPVPWSTAGPTAAGLPTFNFDYTGNAGKSNVFSGGSIGWTASNGHRESILVSTSQNYLGSATTLATPDLSGVGGFLSPPTFGTSVSYSEEIFQSSYAPTSSPAGGSETYVSANGSYMVP